MLSVTRFMWSTVAEGNTVGTCPPLQTVQSVIQPGVVLLMLMPMVVNCVPSPGAGVLQGVADEDTQTGRSHLGDLNNPTSEGPKGGVNHRLPGDCRSGSHQATRQDCLLSPGGVFLMTVLVKSTKQDPLKFYVCPGGSNRW